MRVGVNTLFMIPGEVGGSETYLCETLAAIASGFPDLELVLFTNAENDDALRQRFEPFRQVEFRSLGFHASNRYARIIREQLSLPRAAGAARVDVLWSPGYTAPFSAPCPQVVSILDMQYKSHPEDLTLPARLVTEVLVKAAARNARRIIAISEFGKNEIVRYTAAAPASIHVTPLAADPAYARRLGPTELRERLPFLVPSDAPYLLCVANTYPHKNVHTLVKAFARLETEIPHYLVLVGKPRLGEYALQDAVRQLTNRPRFVRILEARQSDLIALYQQADLFVFPSLYEGFGLPVLEAMTAGAPVVTTRMASIPEVGGDCVCYLDRGTEDDLAEKIRQMVDLSRQPAQRVKWVSRAASRAARFSWTETAARTVQCLKAACAEKG